MAEVCKDSERRGDGFTGFYVSGGSGGHLAGLMEALHSLPRPPWRLIRTAVYTR